MGLRPAVGAAAPVPAYCGENADNFPPSILCCPAALVLGAADCGRGRSTAAGCCIVAPSYRYWFPAELAGDSDDERGGKMKFGLRLDWI